MDDDNINEVSIVNIKMPFWSMVAFMVKASIAFIPAFIILSIIGSFVFALLGGLLGGTGRY
jgi:hypothetical protein